MFEGLIEKLLLSYFGKYINDINKSDLSLGIMQGDFTISNVTLKPEIMQLVDLPLELKFSFIDKLMIQIPWKQIFSQPVKIHIQNLFIIVTTKEQWDLSSIHSFENKQQQIEAFIRLLIEKKAEQNQNFSQSGGKKIQDKNSLNENRNSLNGSGGQNVSQKEGFIDKIIARIIDNVQIVITNMHLRFEYTLEKPFFNWGIFLQELKIQTMEEDFSTPKFFNRNAKGNKRKPIYKLVDLKTLTAYWNTHEQNLWSMKNPRKQKHKMKELVLGSIKADQLIQVNLKAKITINLDKEEWKKPELQVAVDFNEINIHISNRQLQDMLKFIDLINQYHSAIDIETNRFKLYLPDINMIFHQNIEFHERKRLINEFHYNYFPVLFRRHIKKMRFKAYYKEIFNSKRPIKDVLQDKFQNYKDIIETVDSEDLFEWITSALNLNEKQKSSGISSYFSYLKFWESGSSQQAQTSSQTNLDNATGGSIFGYIKDQVRQQKIQEFQPTSDDASEYPSNYVSFKFKLTMMKGQAKISRHARNNTLEEMVLNWKDLEINFDKSKIRNNISMKIFDIGIILNSIVRQSQPSPQKNNNQADLANPQNIDRSNKFSQINKPYQKPFSSSLQKNKQPQQADSMKGGIGEEESQKKQHQIGDSMNSQGNISGDSEFKCIQLMKKVFQDINEPLVSLEMELEKNLSTDQVVSIIIKCHVQSTEFIYYPTTLKQILQLFQINKQQYKRINLLALKKIDKIQQQSMKGLEGMLEGEKTIDILVNIKSPFIVVPFHMKRNSECWLLDLGDILITYHEQQQGDIAEKKYYDQVSITVDNIQMQFYSTLELCNEYLKKQSKEEKATFIENHANSFKIANRIIEEFSVSLDIYVRKKKAESQNFAKLKIMASLQSIKLNLSEYNLKKLFELMKLFQELDDEQSQQIIIEEKKNILDQSIKIGLLSKRGNTYKSWSQVYAVLSDQYLYLYQTPDKTIYTSYINLQGYQIISCPESEVGAMHSFKLQKRKDKKDIHYFKCSDAHLLNEWIIAINQILDLNLQLDAETAMMMGINNAQFLLLTEEDNKLHASSNNYNYNMRMNTSLNDQLNISNLESIQMEMMSEDKSFRVGTTQNIQYLPAHQIESMNIQVTCMSVELKVYKMQVDRQWINIQFEGLKAGFSQRSLDFSVEVSLNSFLLNDYIFEYPQKSLHPILSSNPIIAKTTTGTSNSAHNGFGMQSNNKPFYQGNKHSKINLRSSTNQNRFTFKPFLKLEFKQIEKSHPQYKKSNSDLIIKIQIKDLYANWKPEQIRDIINFFMEKKVKEKEEKFLKDRGKQNLSFEDQFRYSNRNRNLGSSQASTYYTSTNQTYLTSVQQQIKQEQIKNQSTLLKIVVEIDQLNLYLINNYHQNHNLLCSLSAAQTNVSVDIKEYELSVGCSISDLIAQDGMNYPYTKPGWIDKQNLNDKKQYIFGLKKDPKGEKVFNMSFNRYDEGHPDLQNNNINKVTLNFQNLEVSYFQQPILRIIDYILAQIIPVCADEYDLPKIMKEDPVEMLKRMANPKFTDMKINLLDISVLLKASPTIQNFIRLEAQSIKIYSSPYLSEKRLLKSQIPKIKDVWAVGMNIDIEKAQLFYKSEFMQSEKPISNIFDYQLKIDRATYLDEYNICYSNKIEIDKQILITGKIDHLKLKLLREEYLCLMRFIFNNVLFDDFEDSQFLANYDETKNNLPTPLVFSLNFNLLTLEIHDLFEQFAGDEQQFNNLGNLYDRPLISLTLQDSFLSFNKTPIRHNTFIMNASQVTGYNISWKYEKDKQIYQIQGFYDTLDEFEVEMNPEYDFIIDYVSDYETQKQQKQKTSKQNPSPQKKSSILVPAGYTQSIPQLRDTTNTIKEKNQIKKFTLNCSIKPDGQKEIDITLTNFELLFGIGFLFNIINFTYMDDSVTVVQPSKKVNPSPMILILDINNVQLYLQGPSKEYSLACLGKFQISMIKNENQDQHENYHQELEMNEDIGMDESSMLNGSINCQKQKQFSPCSTMKINVSDLEMYTHRFNTNSNNQQISAVNISNIHYPINNQETNKQNHQSHVNLINPCTICYDSSNYSCFCDDENLKYFNQTRLYMEKIRCRFSYKDLAIVYETSLLQTQQMQKVRTFNEKLFDVATTFQQQNSSSPYLNYQNFQTSKTLGKQISQPNLPQLGGGGSMFQSVNLILPSQRGSMQLQPMSFNYQNRNSGFNIYNQYQQNILVEDCDSLQSQFQDYQCDEVEDESECQSQEHPIESQNQLSSNRSPKDVADYNFTNHRNSTILKESVQLPQPSTSQTIQFQHKKNPSNLSRPNNTAATNRLSSIIPSKTNYLMLQTQVNKNRRGTLMDNNKSYSMTYQDISPNIQEKKFMMELSNVNSPAHFAAKTHYDMINNIKKIMIDKAQQNYKASKKNVSVYNQSEKKFTIDGIEIIIINNIGDSYLPVLHNNFILSISIVSEQDRSLLDGYVTIGVSYYNPFVGRMEPIIEQSQFQINLIRGEKANPKFFFSLEQASENSDEQDDQKNQKKQKQESIVRITISDTMIGILTNAFKEWQKYIELIRQNNLQIFEVNQTQEEQKHKQKIPNQKIVNIKSDSIDETKTLNKKNNQAKNSQNDKANKYQQGQENCQNMETNSRFQDKITVFSVINETGYKFVSIKKLDKIEQIKEENNNKIDIEVDSNEEDFSHTFNQEIQLEIYFQDIKGMKYVIKNVKINRQKVVKYNWWEVDYVEGNRVEVKDKYFIQNVQVKDNKTMLIISSPYLFYNLTQYYIDINLENLENNLNLNFAASEKYPIPFEYIQNESSKFSIHFFKQKPYFNDKLSAPSIPVQIQNLIKLQEQEMIEIKHHPYTSYFKTVEDKYFMGRVLFIIEPILQFKNALPKRLFLDIYYESENQQGIQSQENIPFDYYHHRVQSSINASNISQEFLQQRNIKKKTGIILEKQQVYEEHFASYNSIISIQIQVEGMEKSEKIVIINQEKIKKVQTYSEKVDLYESYESGYQEDDFNFQSNHQTHHNHHHEGNHYTEVDDENNFASNTIQRLNHHRNQDSKFVTLHLNIDVTSQSHHKIKSKEKDESSKNIFTHLNQLFQVIKKAKRIFVCFYVKTILVNSTPFNSIVFYDYDEQKPRKLVGQSSSFSSFDQKILLMNQEKTLMFSKFDESYASNEVSIKGIGHTFVEAKIPVTYRERVDNYELYEMGIDVRLIQSLPKQKIYTKLIQINPKYVIINKTGFDIDICQTNLYNYPIQIKKDQKRLAWYWKDCTKEKQLCIRINENYLNRIAGGAYRTSTVEWSGSFSIESIRAVHTFCKIKDKYSNTLANQGALSNQAQSIKNQFNEQDLEYFETQLQMEKIFFQASVNMTKSTYFIVLESKDSERDFGYGLLNQCSNISINVQQNISMLQENENEQEEQDDDSLNKNEIFQLNYNQHVSFAWQYPDNKPEIRITFSVNQVTTENEIKKFDFTSVSNLNTQKHVEIINLFNFQNQKDITFNFNDRKIAIRITTQFKKNTKILTFKNINEITPQINQNPSKQSLLDSQIIIEEKQQGNNSTTNKKQKEKNQINLSGMQQSSKLIPDGGEQNQGEEDENSKNSIQKVIAINLKNIGISFIARTKKQNRELNYITLKGLIFEMLEKETSTSTNVCLKYLQIDNNSSRKTFTPVNLTPSQSQLIQSSSYNFFEFVLEREHKDSSILVINSLRAYLFPTTIKIDEEYLDHLLEAIQSVKDNINNENQLTINKKMELSHFLFPNDQEKKYLQDNSQISQLTDKCLYEWQYDDIPEMKKIVQEQTTIAHKKFVALNVIADALGTAFRNIDEAPVKLSGFKIEDQFGTTSNIIHKIKEHYKQCVISALFSVLGSVEIIGNPINLYRRIRQGVGDFALKPIEGLKNEGFVGFGIGMMEGTGSLLKNTIAGTCYSLNKFSGSLASGLSIISSDNEFIEQRKKIMLNKPKHVIQGLQQAGMCIYKGIQGGLKGVVMHPYKGGVDEGVTGFLKGTLKGVSGVITKPLSGALDATAKTAEGLTSIFTVYEDKSRDQRMRLPRILYEKTQYFKEIQGKEEKIVEFLWETFDENQEIEVIDTFVVKEPIIQSRRQFANKKKYATKILILLKNRIFYINTDKKQTEFDITPQEISQVDSKTDPQDEGSIIIQIKTASDKVPKVIRYRRIQHENNQIVEKLKYLTDLID